MIMAHLNLVSDFLSLQSDESSDVLFLARKGEGSAILRATSSLGVVGVVSSLQGGNNGNKTVTSWNALSKFDELG